MRQKRVATAAPGSNKSSRKDYKTNCRIAKTCDKDVAKNNHRSVHFADDTGVPSRIFCSTATSSCTSYSGERSHPAKCHARRNRETFVERRHSVSFTEQRPICFAPIFSSQKDWGSSAGDKSSSVEQIYNSQALQDGELAERDSVGAQGRLHGHNRFKRCLFFDSNSPVSSKISSFQLEEPAVPVCCSSFWPYQCSKSIHESFETGHSKYATKGNSVSNLYRRPNYCGILKDGMQRAGRVCSSVVNRSRFQCKYGKIKLSAENSSGIPRVCVGFDKNGAFSTREEERGHSTKNSKLTHEQTNFSSSNFKYGRLDAVGQMGSNASGYLLPISSTGFEQCSRRNRERLRLVDNVKSRSSAGAKDVVNKLGNVARQSNGDVASKFDNSDRCLPVRMGSSLPEYRQGGQRFVVERGNHVTHQCVRANDGMVCNSNACKCYNRGTCSFSNGQYNRGVLHKQTRWNKVLSNGHNCQENLGLGHKASSSSISRTSARKAECDGGQVITRTERQPRMVIGSGSVLQANQESRFSSASGLVCNTVECPGSKVCILEARSSGVESGRICHHLDRHKSVCVSSVLSDKPPVTKSTHRKYVRNVVNCTSMEDSAMVSNSVKHVGSQTNSTSTESRFASASAFQRGTSSSDHETSRLAVVSQHLSDKGISDEAAELILASWRTGTEQQYSGAWRQWVSWCNKRKSNPLSASIGTVSQFLTSLYASGLSYSTVNTYRSAISMTHLPIDGVPVGSHYLIKRLMKGIFNKRPPVPRYVISWPVEKVLRYLKIMPGYDQISLKLLTWKTAILIALVSADRGDAIAALSTEYMIKDSEGYHFLVSKPTKCTRPGRGIKQIDLPKFTKDRRICVVYCLDKYLRATKRLRVDKQLFISYVKPHRSVTRTSIARWIKLIMQKSGIDVSIFQPHSTRSASTSTAFQQGVSVPDILKKADWSNASVFHRFYNRPKVHADFAQAILSVK